MVGLVKLVGIIIVVMGAIFLVKPATYKKYINFWMKGNRLYPGGILSLLFGIIFLRAASNCALSWFVFLVGILSLTKGILAFALGPKKIKPFLEQMENKPDSTLRVLAVLALAIGILLIYAA